MKGLYDEYHFSYSGIGTYSTDTYCINMDYILKQTAIVKTYVIVIQHLVYLPKHYRFQKISFYYNQDKASNYGTTLPFGSCRIIQNQFLKIYMVNDIAQEACISI